MIIKIISLNTLILGNYLNTYYLNTFENYSLTVFRKNDCMRIWKYFWKYSKLFKYNVFVCWPTLTMTYMSSKWIALISYRNTFLRELAVEKIARLLEAWINAAITPQSQCHHNWQHRCVSYGQFSVTYVRYIPHHCVITDWSPCDRLSKCMLFFFLAFIGGFQ